VSDARRDLIDALVLALKGAALRDGYNAARVRTRDVVDALDAYLTPRHGTLRDDPEYRALVREAREHAADAAEWQRDAECANDRDEVLVAQQASADADRALEELEVLVAQQASADADRALEELESTHAPSAGDAVVVIEGAYKGWVGYVVQLCERDSEAVADVRRHRRRVPGALLALFGTCGDRASRHLDRGDFRVVEPG
jgi:hypothetical protein